MKPVILIASDDGYNPMFQAPHTILDLRYSKMILAGGGVPVGTYDLNCVNEYCAMADALVLTGGSTDIHAGNYGELFPADMRQKGWRVNELRDDSDFALCKAFLAAKKPILGIGRGLQILNVQLGGSLYQDLLEMTGEEHKDVSHLVTTEPGSFIASVYGAEQTVNSFHHQGIKALGENLQATAKSPKGLIEAVEHTSLPVIGVQWHPEHAKNEADHTLFSKFISLCKGGARG